MACGATANALARTIGERFLAQVQALFAREHKLVEKYGLETDAAGGGGGEYALQDGFGWTNGVTLMLLNLYPGKDAKPHPPSGCASPRRPRAEDGASCCAVRGGSRVGSSALDVGRCTSSMRSTAVAATRRALHLLATHSAAVRWGIARANCCIRTRHADWAHRRGPPMVCSRLERSDSTGAWFTRKRRARSVIATLALASHALMRSTWAPGAGLRLHRRRPRIMRTLSLQDGPMAVRTLNEFLAHSREKDVSPDPFELENPHLLEVRLNGMVWSKAGAMVARTGNVKFTREGLLEQGLGNLLKKAVSGEGMQLMKAEGQGRVYLADLGKLVTLLRLNGESIFVNGNDVLAFESGVEHKITMMRKVAGMLGRAVQRAPERPRHRGDHLALRAADLAGHRHQRPGVHRPQRYRRLVRHADTGTGHRRLDRHAVRPRLGRKPADAFQRRRLGRGAAL